MERRLDCGYVPIACALHDRLEALATVGREVEMVVRDEGGVVRVVRDRLVDVFAREGAEYVRTGGGERIRLDRLESVDGVPFTGDAGSAAEGRC